jgi:hypothetical protein
MAQAVPVLVFDNPNFVDTGGTIDDESDTLQAALIATGNSVTTFTDTTPAGIAAALQGQTVLVIPEQEIQGIATLPDASLQVIRDFVNGGGGLIIAADYQNTLNALFGYNLDFVGAGPSVLDPVAAAGTTFINGPLNLGAPDNTGGFTLASLPPGARSIYSDGTASTVTLFNVGQGQVVQLGYDFFDAQPLGSQNGGFLTVLDLAVAQVSGDQTGPVDPGNPGGTVPEPGSLALTAAAFGACAVARRRRR